MHVRVSSNYFVPQEVNTVSKTTFYFTAIQDWNSLPVFVKQQNNYVSFKRKVKQFLVARALCKKVFLHVQHSLYISSINFLVNCVI